MSNADTFSSGGSRPVLIGGPGWGRLFCVCVCGGGLTTTREKNDPTLSLMTHTAETCDRKGGVTETETTLALLQDTEPAT